MYSEIKKALMTEIIIPVSSIQIQNSSKQDFNLVSVLENYIL